MLKDFFKLLDKVNQLTNCQDWIFYSGMLFGSKDKWWGDWKTRYSDHEGLDITFYRDSSNNIYKFNSSIFVPTIFNGKILNICDDFLGQSVIIGHEECKIEKSIIATIYSHILVDSKYNQNKLKAGMSVVKGQIIGKIADTSTKKSKIVPHLHISFAEISLSIPFEQLNWTLFSNLDNSPYEVKFFNPIQII